MVEEARDRKPMDAWTRLGARNGRILRREETNSTHQELLVAFVPFAQSIFLDPLKLRPAKPVFRRQVPPARKHRVDDRACLAHDLVASGVDGEEGGEAAMPAEEGFAQVHSARASGWHRVLARAQLGGRHRYTGLETAVMLG